ncbi:zinc-dependent metalloprotease [Psychroserpens sp. SPM9]|uniref:zinc-dependent metalloprotease n=1 Tax=Psychroserpens sp. SPM9 TaxID=2975598 RepID=UPI0021A52DDB|nr:zinc-dependent metalloprotease [Psychroserpens sp. SPM9]MDG5490528.1 zinc-dependent metalloprotease [Psychroserpens sp. SPM9]
MTHKTTYIQNIFTSRTNKRRLLTSIFTFAILTISTAQEFQITGEAIEVEGPVCEYYPAPNQEPYSIPNTLVRARQGAESNGTVCSNFIVTYNGFTPEAQAAFQYAVDIWANTLESDQPIRVDATFSPLGANVLGSAGPTGFIPLTGPGIPPNTAYARALAEQITGTDTNAGGPDISANFSSTANFYFGLDANPPFNQVDFVSVVLHELGHGLGFLGFATTDETNTQGVLRNSGFVHSYDNFVETLNGDSILSFTDPSATLLNQYTGGNLFSNSPLALAANGGLIRPELWAPSPFSQGSSYSHWDEFVFPSNNVNSLMTPSIGNGQANHNPGPITIALFEDMGWAVCPSLSVEDITLESLQVAPNPFNESIRITLPGNYNDSDFNLSIYDINGRVVFEKETSSANRTIDIDLSPLKTSMYFMQLEDQATGVTITKKIVKH